MEADNHSLRKLHSFRNAWKVLFHEYSSFIAILFHFCLEVELHIQAV